MKVIVFGANGRLGSDLMYWGREWGHEMVGMLHDDCAIEDYVPTSPMFDADMVVNTVAVHEAKECAEYPSYAWDVNVKGAQSVSFEAWRAAPKAECIYISTECVFDDLHRACSILSIPDAPLSDVYGATKRLGEESHLLVNPMASVTRVSMLFGPHPCRGKSQPGFIDRCLESAKQGERMQASYNTACAITYTKSVADALFNGDRSRRIGRVEHCVSSQPTSHYELAQTIYNLMGMERSMVEPVRAAKGTQRYLASEYQAPTMIEMLSEYIEHIGELK
jgi:dTDP-4-dehydrorhamnose reductase